MYTFGSLAYDESETCWPSAQKLQVPFVQMECPLTTIFIDFLYQANRYEAAVL